MDLSEKDVIRFWSKVNQTSGCWLWTGPTNGCYGNLGVGGRKNFKMLLAHRVSWTLNKGPIPLGKFVLHHCDVMLCIRPSHLFLGTQRDNILDCLKKGRFRTHDCRGLKNGRAKLKLRQVLSIRSSLETCRSLAGRYGVSSSLISHIRSKKLWRHV